MNPALPMTDLEGHIDRRSYRQVLYVMLLVSAMSMLMLIFEVLGRLEVLDHYREAFSWGEITSEIMVVVGIFWAGPLALREINKRRQATWSAQEARSQVKALFDMTDMLQSALGYGDANAVLRATAAKLLPGFGGALYVFNNSGDRLELSSS